MARKKKEIVVPVHCATVREYEKTPYWRKKSQGILDNKECVCAICGRKRWEWMPRAKRWKKRRFSVHHSTYAHCPHELPEELYPLCTLCHTQCHTILQCENIGQMFKELAGVVRRYFFYEGIDTFIPW